MAIVINKVAQKSKRALKFSDLILGDVFANEYGNWYIRTRNTYDEYGEFIGNAIDLNGDFACFDSDDSVKKFRKDLTIECSNDDITEWYE